MNSTRQSAGNEVGERIIISIDAMGGDRGPSAVVSGMARSQRKNPDIGFIVHGRRDELEPLIARKRGLGDVCEIRDVPDIVTMTEKPAQVIRNGKNTSMWSALDSVKQGEAEVCVSCGNTGALMMLSVVRLRKLPGVDRPAIAVLWPSRNPQGFNVMLDAGADIRADERDLATYSAMGVAYARSGLGIERPRVGLLNVGTEEHKGRAELKLAHEHLQAASVDSDFDYVGFVEGGDLPSDRCDVVVTDGFTGNVALKTGEGTANLIADQLREAFRYSILSRLASLLALTSLRRLKKRIDPRRVNGGVFLGLNGTVVKSHGSADSTGVSAAIKLAYLLTQQRFSEKLAARVASAPNLPQTATTGGNGGSSE
ncbi:phosphate:acyl-[acyl carrier protein] acyltransferase [Poseidonocella pacifica]|uniref:Phosphate acyltransferase n=1 Tax=Poseidonocella pacifica TaxID=871651 RepID=A0A1I0VL65_9RHOB|nr:phosphate acyltransferase PlsX [Poseidonocella pacifica]SFA77051.1 phosphate:acyl-[acyl carrier protein] acyltransferase [Poseidonocella pacifica]